MGFYLDFHAVMQRLNVDLKIIAYKGALALSSAPVIATPDPVGGKQSLLSKGGYFQRRREIAASSRNDIMMLSIY
ncbi:MAG: hypothetical protein AMK69_09505 [Nitrospira bacterium SG8_3]|nr:MAG: hypothetical protein AMK69_09505 [Nitrospira bacterium SG8_3]